MSNVAGSLEDKVNVSLMLADLTFDVNHVLGALIYLLQAVTEDFDALVNKGQEPPIPPTSDYEK